MEDRGNYCSTTIQSKLTEDTLFVVIGGLISTAIGFVVFRRIHSRNPTLLKPVDLTPTAHETTYEWDLILEMVFRCLTIGYGIASVVGLIVFLTFRVWIVDINGLIAIILVMSYYILRELDRTLNRFARSPT